MIEEMCDKAVDVFLPTLKFIRNWFVTNKMLDDAVFSNDDIDLNSEHFLMKIF